MYYYEVFRIRNDGIGESKSVAIFWKYADALCYIIATDGISINGVVYIHFMQHGTV